MYLEDICVLPAFRSKGVGKALMQATAREALSGAMMPFSGWP